MKYLGIDYGTKRIGIAISDESGQFAFPKKIISNGTTAIAEILDLLAKEKIETIVIGNSMTTSGERNTVMKNVDLFIVEIRKCSEIPVVLQDERFSSMMARSMDHKKSDSIANPRRNNSRVERIDDRAAALLLQRYLDKTK
jgi:putative pre-16S rRNA nuclease